MNRRIAAAALAALLVATSCRPTGSPDARWVFSRNHDARHPLIVVGDGIFQVHRAQVVHGGQYYFTSVTPKPFFEFPYPVALYVFAQPFWSWFPA